MVQSDTNGNASTAGWLDRPVSGSWPTVLSARMPGTLRRILGVDHRSTREDADVGIEHIVGLGAVFEIEAVANQCRPTLRAASTPSVECTTIQRVINSLIELSRM